MRIWSCKRQAVRIHVLEASIKYLEVLEASTGCLEVEEVSSVYLEVRRQAVYI